MHRAAPSKGLLLCSSAPGRLLVEAPFSDVFDSIEEAFARLLPGFRLPEVLKGGTWRSSRPAARDFQRMPSRGQLRKASKTAYVVIKISIK